MSEKSLHRTPGMSSSRNVSYYCEYSNLLALVNEKFSARNLPVGGNARMLCIACGWRCRPTQMEFQLPESRRLFPHPESWEVSKELGLRFPKSSSFLALPWLCHPLPSVSTGHEIKEEGRRKRRRILNLKGKTRSLLQALSWISRS